MGCRVGQYASDVNQDVGPICSCCLHVHCTNFGSVVTVNVETVIVQFTIICTSCQTRSSQFLW